MNVSILLFAPFVCIVRARQQEQSHAIAIIYILRHICLVRCRFVAAITFCYINLWRIQCNFPSASTSSFLASSRVESSHSVLCCKPTMHGIFLSFFTSHSSIILSQKTPKNNWIFVVHHNNRSAFLCENFIILLSLCHIFQISLIPFYIFVVGLLLFFESLDSVKSRGMETKYTVYYLVQMEATNLQSIQNISEKLTVLGEHACAAL